MMKIKILSGLLIIVAVLVIGCMEKPIAVCGNGVIEEGETSENCCIDVGCLEGQSCEGNVCVELEKYEEHIILENDTDVDKGKIGTDVGTANPAYVYCDTMYPDQPKTFGTCHYAGRANDEYSSVKCEGDCGYGCVCTPDCGHPSSEHCQNTPDEEITCICAGSSCERPCFFPDGTNCPLWDFYAGKCGQEWSYCTQHGYAIETKSEGEDPYSPEYSVCINETSMDTIGVVSDLMNLGGEETGMANPASVYCYMLGYKSRINETRRGQRGICIFPDESECSEWDFYAGLCGQEWSYCKQNGYDMKVKSDGEDPYSPNAYSVCIDKESKSDVGLVVDLIHLEEEISGPLK